MSQRRKLGKYTVQLAGIYTMSLSRKFTTCYEASGC